MAGGADLKRACWSHELSGLTQAALDGAGPVTTIQLCLKNIDGRFGFVLQEDLIARRWIVHERDGAVITAYPSASLLVAAGWAID